MCPAHSLRQIALGIPLTLGTIVGAGRYNAIAYRHAIYVLHPAGIPKLVQMLQLLYSARVWYFHKIG